MRAIVCTEYAPPENLSVQQVNEPSPGKGQVLIDIKAAGVGFVDGLYVQGLYQVKPPLPFTPGNEISGVVSQIGEGVDTLKTGDRVLAMSGFGGFAEQACVAAGGCVPIPENLSFEQAAGFVVAYSTALFGLRDRASLMPGETLLVLGAAGSVGLAAIDVARVMGAEIVAAASTDEKRQLCIEQGAHHTLDYTQENWRQTLKEMLGSKGLNMVYDPVGGPTSELALRSLVPKGRLLVIGFASGEIPRIPLNLALLKQCQIVGVDWGGYARADPANNGPILAQLMAWAGEGKLNPASPVPYPLERAGQAMRDLLDRKLVGKAVIVP